MNYNMPAVEALSASIGQYAAEQERVMQSVVGAADKVLQAEFWREAERDTHQRELG